MQRFTEKHKFNRLAVFVFCRIHTNKSDFSIQIETG